MPLLSSQLKKLRIEDIFRAKDVLLRFLWAEINLLNSLIGNVCKFDRVDVSEKKDKNCDKSRA